jgi:hypothetical protein
VVVVGKGTLADNPSNERRNIVESRGHDPGGGCNSSRRPLHSPAPDLRRADPMACSVS